MGQSVRVMRDCLSGVSYRVFPTPKKPYVLTELVGFDTEAYETGYPICYATSDGKIHTPRRFIPGLFKNPQKRIDYVVWNLRYDSGAVLYFLPRRKKKVLWERLEVKHRGIKYSYIPHKLLCLKKGNRRRNFWDVMPFYASSLDAAAQKYLGEKKLILDTKRFSRRWVRANRQKLYRYNVHDANLTKKLGELLLRRLDDEGIKTSALYSTAYVSAQHFRRRCGLVDVTRWWDGNRDVLRAAWESYYGGKFEVTARGTCEGHEYDISAAYGYEISNLLDLQYSRVVRSKKPVPDARYGFLRCILNIPNDLPSPVPYRRKILITYPVGRFRATITLNEYLWLRRHDVKINVEDGYWFIFSSEAYPFRREIERIYRQRQEARKSDPMRANILKLLINSLYGKFASIITDPDGNRKASQYWNPIYASIITANTRLRVTEVQRQMGDDCIAVHTDSVITRRKMPDKFCDNKLGGWRHEYSGKTLVVASGIYQVGEKSARRGYVFSPGYSWEKTLHAAGDAETLNLSDVRVKSWTGQIARGLDEDINLFSREERTMSLNCDGKRIWPERTNARKLLAGLQYSLPIKVMDK